MDADTVRALCEALATYEGTIITVSHDEAYVNRVLASGGEIADGVSKGEIWILSHHTLRRYDGGFKDYKKQVLKKVRSLDEPSSA